MNDVLAFLGALDMVLMAGVSAVGHIILNLLAALGALVILFEIFMTLKHLLLYYYDFLFRSRPANNPVKCGSANNPVKCGSGFTSAEKKN